MTERIEHRPTTQRVWTSIAAVVVVAWFAFVLTRNPGDDVAETLPAVTIRPPQAALNVGDTIRFQASVNFDDPCDCRWASSDPHVATVDATGLVRARLPGWATIFGTLPSRALRPPLSSKSASQKPL